MKQMLAAVVTAVLVCSSPAAFAQDAAPASGNNTASQAQEALDALKNMSPEERQQLYHTGVSQVQNLSPEQLKQLKAQFDSLTPEQKEQLQTQVMQQLQNSPQLKAEAEQQLQKLTPAQQQQLMDTNQK